MMSIGLRAIKISLAAVLAVIAAQLLGLENVWSAGVIAILSVLDTRKDSLQTGIARMICTLCAFSVGILVFYWLGFTVWAFGLYLLVFLPLAMVLRVDVGVAPCTVLVTHFLIAQSISWHWQLNGWCLMLIGLLAALLLNTWMPSQRKEIRQTLQEAEGQVRHLLTLIHEQLLQGQHDYRQLKEEVRLLQGRLKQLHQLALIDYQNQIFNTDPYYLSYTEMRMRQTDILEGMVDNFQHYISPTAQNEALAAIIHQLAEEFHEENTGVELLDRIQDLYRYFKQSDLPKSREEFESRAILYHLILELEAFIQVKHDFYLQQAMKAKGSVDLQAEADE